MGYYVRLLKPKFSPAHWKLQFVSHKKMHAKDSKAKKPKKEWDIPKSRWFSLGFQSKMTTDQASARALITHYYNNISLPARKFPRSDKRTVPSAQAHWFLKISNGSFHPAFCI